MQVAQVERVQDTFEQMMEVVTDPKQVWAWVCYTEVYEHRALHRRNVEARSLYRSIYPEMRVKAV
jgi:carbamoylphosphate synthase large subunit